MRNCAFTPFNFLHSTESVVVTGAITMRIGIIIAIVAIVAVGIAGYYVFMTLAAPGTPLDQEPTTASNADFIVTMLTRS